MFLLLFRYHVAHNRFEPAINIAITVGLAYGSTAKATLIITARSYDEIAVKAVFTASSIGDYSLLELVLK